MTLGKSRAYGEAPNGASPEARHSAGAGEISRARSAYEAAQSELHTIQLKLAPLRLQERRALEKLAETRKRLSALILSREISV